MLVFYVTSSISHKTDKGKSVIGWGIFRLYANVEVMKMTFYRYLSDPEKC